MKSLVFSTTYNISTFFIITIKCLKRKIRDNQSTGQYNQTFHWGWLLAFEHCIVHARIHKHTGRQRHKANNQSELPGWFRVNPKSQCNCRPTNFLLSKSSEISWADLSLKFSILVTVTIAIKSRLTREIDLLFPKIQCGHNLYYLVHVSRLQAEKGIGCWITWWKQLISTKYFTKSVLPKMLLFARN